MKHLFLLVLAACVSTKAPVSPSTPDLAARRAQMIAWLHDYASAGQFPMDEAGRPLSVFRDSRGVRCPMAELIYRSGHGDLVDQVARTHNDLRLADVHGGPLYAWITASGLTQDEVVMIQGAMTVEEMRQIREAHPGGRFVLAGPSSPQVGNQLSLARAWGEVAGHLATAEVALKLQRTAPAPRTTPASPRILETMR